jgi:hypothetical protein
MLEARGMEREHVEYAIAAHPTWAPLVTLMGGIIRDQLPGREPGD